MKINIRTIFTVMSFSLIVLAYAIMTDNYSEWNNIKYFGIFFLIGIIVYCKGGNIGDRLSAFLICYFVLLFLLCSIIQGSVASTIPTNLFYVVVLLCISLYGKYVFFSNKTILAVAIAIAVTILFVLLLSKTELDYQFAYRVNDRLRLYGKFSHPNIFASMCTSVIILLSVYKRYEKQLSKIRTICINLVIILAIIICTLTNSRTSLTVILTYYYIYFIYYLSSVREAKSRAIFKMIIFTATLIGGYIVMIYYVIRQETFGMRMDDYLRISMQGIDLLFGSHFGGSVENGSFEFVFYTIVDRMGLFGVIGFALIFIRYFKKVNNQNKKLRYISYSVLGAYLVSCIGEAFIVNITNVFPIVMYMLCDTVTSKQTTD